MKFLGVVCRLVLQKSRTKHDFECKVRTKKARFYAGSKRFVLMFYVFCRGRAKI
jgi:hypothetical protein